MTQYEALQRIAGLRVLIVGDVMLDLYRVATATRISPEAPVPVLLSPSTEYRLGGAGAVAAMCRALGASVDLISVVGCDTPGEKVRELVETIGIRSLIVNSPFPRPTTVKERICGVASGRHRQQLCRVDTESTKPLTPGESAGMADLIAQQKSDAIIIADYAKGVCTDRVVQACRTNGAPVFVDPPKGVDWTRFYNVECVVPNREEAAHKSARDLCRQLQCRAAVVKLDQDGCELSYDRRTSQKFPSRTRVVHDVTSAGDNFISALACMRAAGADWPEATYAANAAAGLQVERYGSVPVTLSELQQELSLCQFAHV